MARTKQTARKSSYGSAPRRQLATTSARAVRSYFQNQQAAGGAPTTIWGSVVSRGSGAAPKKIFVNCENTFGEFKFKRAPTSELFTPVLSLGRVSTPHFPRELTEVAATSLPTSGLGLQSSDLLMRVDFSSVMDGNDAYIRANRPPLDAVFVIDISGSMAESFQDDTDHRSKFNVAAECVNGIVDKLSGTDRASIIAFNNDATVVSPLNYTTATAKSDIKKALKGITVGGGTALAKGLLSGYKELRDAEAVDPCTSIERMKRVFFLTDMQSSLSDENRVLEVALQEASLHEWLSKAKNTDDIITSPLQCLEAVGKRKSSVSQPSTPSSTPKRQKITKSPIFINLIGIGVDLSVATVERISAIPGAKYVSVSLASELRQTVMDDFNFDVTPLAFNINLALPDGLTIQKVYGSAELNDLKPLSSSAVISTEFPVPLDDQGHAQGGLYVMKLGEDGLANRSGAELPVRISWLNGRGEQRETVKYIVIPAPLSAGETITSGCDQGLVKARILVEYVDQLTRYMLEEESEATATTISEVAGSASAPVSGSSSRAVITSALKMLRGGGLSQADIPNEIPDTIQKHFQNALKFQDLKRYVVSGLLACGDSSLSTNNKNIVDTLDQIVDVEIKEIDLHLDELEPTIENTSNVPKGMMCPITLALMTDPVIASDGHSYERKAIENWFRSHRTAVSPLTNLPLPDATLIPNRALKIAIEDYRLKVDAST